MTRAQANRLMELCEKAEREGALYGRDREEQERLGEILRDSGIVDTENSGVLDLGATYWE